MKLALEWNTALSKYASQAGIQQQRDFIAIQGSIEAQSAQFFDNLRDIELPAAIDNATEQGHHTVGFYTPSWNLNSDAFITFRSWLREQGYTCMCARLDPAEREHPDQDVVLNIIPVSESHRL